jgi:hypothetical protein
MFANDGAVQTTKKRLFSNGKGNYTHKVETF